MKMNGGVKKEDLGKENVEAVKKGCANLGRHIENVKPVRRAGGGRHQPLHLRHGRRDPGDEGLCRLDGRRGDPVQALGARARPASRSWRTRWWSSPNPAPSQFAPLYPDDMPLFDKINTIVQRIYRGSRGDRRQVGARPAACLGSRPATAICRSAWPRRSIPSRPIRTCAARRPATPCRCARSAVGRRRLRRRHLRRDHDHARPAQGAVVGKDLPQREGPDRRAVLRTFAL